MLSKVLLPAVLILTASACERPPEFSPAPGTYSESQATIDGVAGRRAIARIDSTFFSRNLPLLGRLILPQEYNDGSSVVMISHAFWVERFAGRPDVIGSKLEVDGVPRTIVGVMAQGVDVPEGVALWVPRKPEP